MLPALGAATFRRNGFEAARILSGDELEAEKNTGAPARHRAIYDATFSWSTDAAGSEAGACTADDPVDGNPATAADGTAGTHRTRDGRQPLPRHGRARSGRNRRAGRRRGRVA